MPGSPHDDLAPDAAPGRDVAEAWPAGDPFPELVPTASSDGPSSLTPPPPGPVLGTAFLQLASATRTGFFGVLLLVIGQLLFVVPALELAERQRRLAGEHQRLSDLEPRLAALAQPLDALRQRADEAMEAEVERFLTGLGDDLERLERTVEELRAADAPISAEAPITDDAPITLAEPMSPTAAAEPAVEGWPIADPELRFDIARAATPEELRRVLEPLVDEEISAPRIGRLNSAWKSEVLPYVEARIDGLASDLSHLRAFLPEAEEGWTRFASALTELRDEARQLTIKAPEARWWGRVEAGRLRLRPGDRRPLLDPLDRFGAALDRVHERRAAVASRLDVALGALPSPDSTLGRELRTATPGWAALAVCYPALLGFLLAAFSFWRSRSVFALRRALELYPDRRSILWLRSSLAGGTARRPRGLSWACLHTVLAAVISALWLGLSAWHQNRAADFSDRDLLLLLAVGGGFVLSAAVYRLLALHAVWSVEARVVEPPARAPEPPDPQDAQDVLDLHTLRS